MYKRQVTNCIVHGYREKIDKVYITANIYSDNRIVIKIKDKGCGIEDVKKAMEPLFTTAPEEEQMCIRDRFMMWPTHKSVEVTQNILQSWMPLYEKPDYYHWAITLDGTPIGAVGLYILNERAGVGDLGYSLSKKWWKHGIMSEAVQAVIDFAFETVDVYKRQGIDNISHQDFCSNTQNFRTALFHD